MRRIEFRLWMWGMGGRAKGMWGAQQLQAGQVGQTGQAGTVESIWTAQMAQAVLGILGARVSGGHVVTKYDHTKGARTAPVTVSEAAHPVPDDAGVAGGAQGETDRGLRGLT